MSLPQDLLHHYAVLGLKPGAGLEEVERAYAEMMDLYQDDSRAIYGLYEEKELRELRQALQESHQALRQALQGKATAPAVPAVPGPPSFPLPAAEASPLPLPGPALTLNLEQMDGALLRRVREHRHLTLAQLSHDTKVREDYLQALEEERVDVFAARVYLLGFLKLYLRAVGLDPERGSVAYLANVRRKGQAAP